jgi:hypothetical protein
MQRKQKMTFVRIVHQTYIWSYNDPKWSSYLDPKWSSNQCIVSLLRECSHVRAMLHRARPRRELGHVSIESCSDCSTELYLVLFCRPSMVIQSIYCFITFGRKLTYSHNVASLARPRESSDTPPIEHWFRLSTRPYFVHISTLSGPICSSIAQSITILVPSSGFHNRHSCVCSV